MWRNQVRTDRCAALIFLIALTARGQTPAPAFEVATVKRSPDVVGWAGLQFPGGGRFEASHVTVKAMVAFAYEVRDFYVSGGPGWAGSDTFDIVAKADASATPAQMRAMLRTLLAERFKLAVRPETKEATVYQLVVAKEGVKSSGLQESSRKIGGIRFLGRGQIEGMGNTLSGLANYLQTLLDQVVVDKTGLTANYDFKLAWSPDESQAGKPGAQAGPANGADPGGPSIFTALQEQLGLKLEATKGPVETMVIERVEKPTDN
jgi:uncharacterized protein (TIGR03435 family)